MCFARIFFIWKPLLTNIIGFVRAKFSVVWIKWKILIIDGGVESACFCIAIVEEKSLALFISFAHLMLSFQKYESYRLITIQFQNFESKCSILHALDSSSNSGFFGVKRWYNGLNSELLIVISEILNQKGNLWFRSASYHPK